MKDASKSMMGQEMMQPFMQPYARLAQRNLQLLTQFSASPEMVSLWMGNAQKMFEQATRAAAAGQGGGAPQGLVDQVQSNVSQVAQSKAFTELIQGMTQNYMEFLFELAQTGMSAFGQEQAKLMGQMQQAASNMMSNADAGKKPSAR